MNNRFFPKLAASNIRKNGKTYIPYIITCIITVMMYYIIKSLSINPGLGDMVGDHTLMYTMGLGCGVVALFACIFLFYTNSFLVKRRKKEFGMFNILGMEKRHLAITLAWETLYVAVISLVIGIVIGIALDKVMFLVITKVLEAEISLGFFISAKAIKSTVVLFIVIYTLIYLNAVRQIRGANPIELLHGGNAGEKEPKTKWVMALTGVASIAGGYYIALTTENPISSIGMFFVAVVLVIIGTYLSFMAGSIAFLKMLRKNKKYFYKTKHFTSVSGMIYRMKQNAVGLANICILSTMVLVMVSSTSSLMLGMEDVLHARYPYDYTVYSDETDLKRSQESFDAVRKLQKEKQLSVTEEIQYRYLAFSSVNKGDTFRVNDAGSVMAIDDIATLIFVPLSDYNAALGTNKTLNEGEIFLYSNRQAFDYSVLKVFDKEYKVKEKLDEFLGNGVIAANAANSHFIVVRDMKEMQELEQLQKEALKDIASNLRFFYGFDTDAGEEEQNAFYSALKDTFTSGEYRGTVECKVGAKTSFLGLYGGFFFIGIFLGLLFIMATVLIIYYKQISEGHDDKERFAIMQKVGMSHQEVKASIRSQILTVFFLPLVVAGLHTAAAFPLVSKLLAVLNLLNTKLYVICTLICYLVFSIAYLLIYGLTARVYYRIVHLYTEGSH